MLVASNLYTATLLLTPVALINPGAEATNKTSFHDLIMIYHRWAYFLNTQELVTVFKECGGGVGNFDPRDPDDMHHARRAIFLYLMPGRVKVWLACLDGKLGVVFFVGKPVPDIRKSVDMGLAKRCLDMFERPPDPCRVVGGFGMSVLWDLTSRDMSVHRLELMELLQSDRDGDLYPLTPEELALFPSQQAINQPVASPVT
ncbi:hypothetical protein ACGC1H_000337 [Rhizoctonia solani]|uniref:Fungal-type protein kinase domain-containing protein n=1 Tax=Rhizoctonia solani TaxID=456999 RepID=A0A8H3BAN4_9AGAM|nr:unnamed protein product [Rhizoctonia solani]